MANIADPAGGGGRLASDNTSGPGLSRPRGLVPTTFFFFFSLNNRIALQNPNPQTLDDFKCDIGPMTKKSF